MKIHFFGNCQTRALRQLAEERQQCWTITNTELGAAGDSASDAVAAHVRSIKDADVVVSQPVTAWKGVPELSLDWVKAGMRPGADLIVIPSIVFEGTHPSYTYLNNRFDGLGMPYHEAHTLDMFLRGYRPADIALLLNSPDFYTARFVETGMEASLALLRYREAQADVTVPVSGLMEDLGRSRVVMNSINHPRRLVLAQLLNGICRVLGQAPLTREAGPDYLDYPLIPALPTVLHHLGIKDEPASFVMRGERYSRDEYLSLSLAYYSRMLRGDLVSAISGSRAETFLAAFGSSGPYASVAAKALPPSARAQVETWVRELYSVFLDRPAVPTEVEATVDYIGQAGVRGWLAAFDAAPELQTRFRQRMEMLLN